MAGCYQILRARSPRSVEAEGAELVRFRREDADPAAIWRARRSVGASGRLRPRSLGYLQWHVHKRPDGVRIRGGPNDDVESVPDDVDPDLVDAKLTPLLEQDILGGEEVS